MHSADVIMEEEHTRIYNVVQSLDIMGYFCLAPRVLVVICG
jgi:hypothetical protein